MTSSLMLALQVNNQSSTKQNIGTALYIFNMVGLQVYCITYRKLNNRTNLKSCCIILAQK